MEQCARLLGRSCLQVSKKPRLAELEDPPHLILLSKPRVDPHQSPVACLLIRVDLKQPLRGEDQLIVGAALLLEKTAEGAGDCLAKVGAAEGYPITARIGLALGVLQQVATIEAT